MSDPIHWHLPTPRQVWLAAAAGICALPVGSLLTPALGDGRQQVLAFAMAIAAGTAAAFCGASFKKAGTPGVIAAASAAIITFFLALAAAALVAP